jgi:hypothetical protein
VEDEIPRYFFNPLSNQGWGYNKEYQSFDFSAKKGVQNRGKQTLLCFAKAISSASKAP